MSWWLAKGLVTLRSQINAQYPARDKASDGSIGDAAHSSRTSDHNPDSSSNPPGVVRAIDVDEDLAASNGERYTMALAEHLRRSARFGDEPRLSYLIYEARICSAKSAWEWRPYTGVNAHRSHLHISVNARADHDGSAWSVPWERNIMATLDAEDLTNIAKAVWGHKINVSGHSQPVATGAVQGWTLAKAEQAVKSIAWTNSNLIWGKVIPRLDSILGGLSKIGASGVTAEVDYVKMAEANADEMDQRERERLGG